MKIDGALITGGGGFLGSHLAEKLFEKQVPVVCVDDFSTGLRANRKTLETRMQDKLLFIEADVSKEWDFTKQAHQFFSGHGAKLTHVFHFASPASPPHYQRLGLETLWVNSLGLAKALEFADIAKARLIFASTSEIYGDPTVTPQPESYWGNVNTMGPRACYDEAKRFGEALIYTHNLAKKTQHGLVRIFNTYGPRMNPNDGRVIINFLMQALRNEDLTIYGDGSQTRSFCFVSDLVAGILAYAETDLTEPVNIGNDKEFTIKELAQTVIKLFSEKKIGIKYCDLPKDDPQQRRPDLNKARTLLKPWMPKIPLEEGLKTMIHWLQDFKEEKKP